MNDPNTAKAQIVDKLKTASNILVTVSADPSVDQLSACIALTMLLNKYKKNATAVFSGKIPSVLDFLKPQEMIEQTTDSLRDFIIALDKSKADKLRYKVEDDVVKIFITPYRASITDKDLEYSAGDFNVDVIMALGVHHQQDLDAAITAHGRIFHDAVVMSINNVSGGDLGIANWEDLQSSSLSELIANLAQFLDPNLLDPQIATALLTGIVAETSRFSNGKTHPSTMTTSSALLAAGADQQLVNNQLQELIGTVITLPAGTEISPTTSTIEAAASHDDVGDELVIDDSGLLIQQPGPGPGAAHDTTPAAPATAVSLAPTDGAMRLSHDETPSSEPGVQLPDLNVESPDHLEQPERPELEQPSALAAVPADQLAGADPDVSSIEALLGTTVESTPSPLLDEPEAVGLNSVDQSSSTGTQSTAHQTGTTEHAGESDAEAARQAVEAALGAKVSPETVPDPDTHIEVLPQTATSQQPQDVDTSFTASQPLASNGQAQPTYNNPTATIQYEMPTVPEHEPAPLGMSPADQPFTMPMPPVSSMPPAPAVAGLVSETTVEPTAGTAPSTGPTPFLTGSSMSNSAQDGSIMPPPLPPPMMPPTFSGPRR